MLIKNAGLSIQIKRIFSINKIFIIFLFSFLGYFIGSIVDFYLILYQFDIRGKMCGDLSPFAFSQAIALILEIISIATATVVYKLMTNSHVFIIKDSFRLFCRIVTRAGNEQTVFELSKKKYYISIIITEKK